MLESDSDHIMTAAGLRAVATTRGSRDRLIRGLIAAVDLQKGPCIR